LGLGFVGICGLGIAGKKQRRQGDDGEEFVHGDGVYLVYRV
jgi:hypothetical protein